MVRKFMVLGGLLALLGGGGGIYWSLGQAPDFYEEALADVPPAEVREDVVRKLVRRTLRIVENIERRETWSEEFSEQQINIWLAQEFDHDRFGWLPPNVHEPRIQISDGVMHVAFRLDDERMRGIVSCELRPRVSGPNELEVMVPSVRIGLFPLPVDQFIQDIAGRAWFDGWQVECRREVGERMVVVNLDRGRPIQPILETIELKAGVLRVAGRRGSLSADRPLQPLSQLHDRRARRFPPLARHAGLSYSRR
jgi:hypothetical protein